MAENSSRLSIQVLQWLTFVPETTSKQENKGCGDETSGERKKIAAAEHNCAYAVHFCIKTNAKPGYQAN